MALKILGLDGLMEERGRSLSVGQRQLFCVARAVLSSAKVSFQYFFALSRGHLCFFQLSGVRWCNGNFNLLHFIMPISTGLLSCDWSKLNTTVISLAYIGSKLPAYQLTERCTVVLY